MRVSLSLTLTLSFVIAACGCYSGGLMWPAYESSPMVSYNNNYEPFDKNTLIEKYPTLDGIIMTAHEYMEMQEKIEKDRKEVNAPVADEYKLSKGLSVNIQVWGEPEMSSNFQIRPDGIVDLPLVGEIYADGKSIREFKSDIMSRLREYIKDPRVSIQVTSTMLSSNISTSTTQIMGNLSAFGGFSSTGLFYIHGSTKFSKVLAMLGGFSADAELRQVRIIKPSMKKIVIVDWLAYLRDADWRQDVAVNSEDILFVPTKWTTGDQFERDWETVLKYMSGTMSVSNFYKFLKKD